MPKGCFLLFSCKIFVNLGLMAFGILIDRLAYVSMVFKGI